MTQIYPSEATITGKGHQLPVKLYMYHHKRDILPINEAEVNTRSLQQSSDYSK